MKHTHQKEKDMAIAKFDIKNVQAEAQKSAQRVFNAGVGVTDLAVGAVRDYAAGTQKRVAEVQKTVTSFDPAATRAAIVELPATGWTTATDVYGNLVKRGQTLVGRIRRQQSTQDTVAAAETTVAKAKTTRTQSARAGQAAKKTAAKKRTAAKSSAKATRTSAKKTVSAGSRALADAAQKVGD